MDFDFLKQLQGLLGMGGGGEANVPAPDFLSLEGDGMGDYGDYDADPGFGMKDLGLLGDALEDLGGDIGSPQKQQMGAPLMAMPRGTPQMLKDYDQSAIINMPQFQVPQMMVPGLLNPLEDYYNR